MSTTYSKLRKGVKDKYYARGGRVPAEVTSKKTGGKTVINIIQPPAQPASPPPPPMPAGPPPAPPAGPPAAGAAALQAMGAGGPPAMGQFKRGGRVKGCKSGGMVPETAGAGGGLGRLNDEKLQKKMGK